jgi:broad specificity phosphatase PhoE
LRQRRGESFVDFIGRVHETIERLKNSEHQTIPVFTHGQFIRAIMWLFLTGQGEINSMAMKEFYYFLLAFSFPNPGFIKLNFSESETCISNIITNHLKSP